MSIAVEIFQTCMSIMTDITKDIMHERKKSTVASGTLQSEYIHTLKSINLCARSDTTNYLNCYNSHFLSSTTRASEYVINRENVFLVAVVQLCD